MFQFHFDTMKLVNRKTYVDYEYGRKNFFLLSKDTHFPAKVSRLKMSSRKNIQD